MQNANEKNLIIVISGPSGSGKSTVIRQVLAHPDMQARLRFSISTTTRPPRPNEKHGTDYYFISNEEFDAHAAAGDFLEWANVHDARYGTLRSEAGLAWAEGRDLLLELDVQGGRSIRMAYPDALLIFLSVPESELRRRLEARPSSLSPEKLAHEINLRLRNAAKEIKQVDFYDNIVLNEKLDETVDRVISIIRSKKAGA